MDDASSVFDASILTGPVANFPVADSFNRRLERDYSTGDIPHVFVAAAVWELPWGRRSRPGGIVGALVNDWTLTGIVTLQSGIPLAISQTTNNNAFAGFGTQRPNLIGEPALPDEERSVARWFNTGAFAPAPAFTIGTSSRNPVRGPSYRNLDLPSCAACLSAARAHSSSVRRCSTPRTPRHWAPRTPPRAPPPSGPSPPPAIRASCSSR